MAKYKSNLQRLNESRNHYKRLFTEQANVTYWTTACPCSNWDGTNCSGGQQGIVIQAYSNNGNAPVVGDMYTVDQSVGPLAGITWVALQVNPGGSSGGHTSIQQTECDEGPTAGCDLATFQNIMNPHLQNAPQQFSSNLMNNWVPTFFAKYDNHPDGCRFLNKRLSIQEDNLNDLVTAGTHPQWQQMLQAKIAALQALIAHCCSTN